MQLTPTQKSTLQQVQAAGPEGIPIHSVNDGAAWGLCWDKRLIVLRHIRGEYRWVAGEGKR